MKRYAVYEHKLVSVHKDMEEAEKDLKRREDMAELLRKDAFYTIEESNKDGVF
ncbi:MAG: hypothetical protein KIG18_01520 [Candidatus Methanomethylophilaceae archaeon]|nr:hypothetical protein [Candidatus Methanomethylophilaceae archaeon]